MALLVVLVVLVQSLAILAFGLDRLFSDASHRERKRTVKQAKVGRFVVGFDRFGASPMTKAISKVRGSIAQVTVAPFGRISAKRLAAVEGRRCSWRRL